jgi:hypothetical protein
MIGTTLLVPNTIATVAINNMLGFEPVDIPSCTSVIVGLTLAATIFSLWLVKKQELLPKDTDIF